MELTREIIQRMVGRGNGGSVTGGGSGGSSGGGEGGGEGGGGGTSIVDWANITSKPTTISGYGITDAYISGGAIYLGGNSITPLVSGDLNGYATQTWVGQQGFLTSSAISDMATETWVQQQGYLTSSSISDMATKTWVGQQGYITSSAISDMATKTWVGQQNYLTSSALSNYVQKSQTAGLLKNDGTVDTNTYLTSVPNNYLSVDNNGMLSHQIQTNDQLILYGTGNNFGELVISDAALYDVHYLSANANGKMTWDGNAVATETWVNSQGHVASAGALKYSGNTKVEATSVGATVTGVLRSTAGFTVDNSSYNISVKQSLDVSESWPVYNIQFLDTGTATANVCTFAFNGTVESSNGFKKTGSSDNNVLLGGGGTKAVSDFATWMDSLLRAKGIILMNGDTPTLKSPKVTVECVNQGAGRYSLNFTGSYIDSSDVVTPYAPTHYEFDSEVRATAFNANQIVAKTFGVLNSDDTNGVYIHWDSSGYLNFNGDTASPRGYIFDAPVTQSSDASLKSIVSHADFEVDKLATLPLVWFTWKKDERRRMHFGSVAQEWQKVLPEVVVDGPDGMLAMDYGAAAMAAGVTACREVVRLNAEIERLKGMINNK